MIFVAGVMVVVSRLKLAEQQHYVGDCWMTNQQ